MVSFDAGTLPLSIAVKKTYAGYGKGYPCSGCDATVLPSQVEYEVETNGPTLRFHIGCHGLWKGERIRRDRRRVTETRSVRYVCARSRRAPVDKRS